MYNDLIQRRFLARVDSSEGMWACWPWTGGTFAKRGGYGRLQIEKRTRRAHIVSWELANQQPVPAGEVVRHICDNPICVNPRHLLLGTQLDNIRDRVERGREGDRRGLKNGRAKITPDTVRDIRRRYGDGESLASIARSVRLSATTVGKIARRFFWSHVP